MSELNRRRYRAAIVGGSGYGGAELARRLLQHPDVELVRVASVDFVGEPLAAAHPNLDGATDLRFEGISPEEAAREMDVVLLGLPHKVSAQKVPAMLASGARIVDLSGDFRLRDAAAYRRYYGAEHPSQHLLGTFVYGLPELNRERIRAARYVASPGCFATTIELALLPLARAGWLGGTVEIVGITGSSGAGVVPSPTTHHPTRAVNLRTYKPLEHQHIPEITETLIGAGARDTLSLRFVPVSAPLSRGIFATAFAHIPARVSHGEVAAAFASTARGEPFLRVPTRRLPEVAAVSGSNHAEIGFAMAEQVDADGTRVVSCFGVTDNLIKGGAGQAIQSMNLMLGLDETLSLRDPGGWP
jgi:N-acetyl-gamma-glutamyl-phosphate/LysW-gamma-L-alpha-aminoadipyl-6-phosphate reductase